MPTLGIGFFQVQEVAIHVHPTHVWMMVSALILQMADISVNVRKDLPGLIVKKVGIKFKHQQKCVKLSKETNKE